MEQRFHVALRPSSVSLVVLRTRVGLYKRDDDGVAVYLNIMWLVVLYWFVGQSLRLMGVRDQKGFSQARHAASIYCMKRWNRHTKQSPWCIDNIPPSHKAIDADKRLSVYICMEGCVWEISGGISYDPQGISPSTYTSQDCEICLSHLRPFATHSHQTPFLYTNTHITSLYLHIILYTLTQKPTYIFPPQTRNPLRSQSSVWHIFLVCVRWLSPSVQTPLTFRSGRMTIKY